MFSLHSKHFILQYNTGLLLRHTSQYKFVCEPFFGEKSQHFINLQFRSHSWRATFALGLLYCTRRKLDSKPLSMSSSQQSGRSSSPPKGVCSIPPMKSREQAKKDSLSAKQSFALFKENPCVKCGHSPFQHEKFKCKTCDNARFRCTVDGCKCHHGLCKCTVV